MSASVLWLQRALVELGHYHASPTRRYDAATRRAVQAFQTERGLVAHELHSQVDLHAVYGGVVPDHALQISDDEIYIFGGKNSNK